MTLKNWLGTIAVSVGLISTAAAGSKWVADQHYVPRAVFQLALNNLETEFSKSIQQAEIRGLKREQRMIEKKKLRGQAADYELDYLELLVDEIEELEKEVK